MEQIISAVIGTLIAILVLKPVAINIGLVDKPNARKLHTGSIPLIGGIAIYLGLCLSLFIGSAPFDHESYLFIVASGLMVLIGVVDDKRDLSVRTRIVGQMLAASIMIFGADQQIENLGDLIAVGDLNLGWLAVPFTYVAVLGAINAYNMVDGIDGLIGGVTLTTMLGLAVLFYLSGQNQAAMFAMTFALVLLPYLAYNLRAHCDRNKKIFMGDAGSMFIGLSVIWLLAMGSQGKHSPQAFKAVTALWLVAIPLIDMAGVMVRRIKKGQSPFKPDRDHLHHIFMRAGFSSREALVIITLLSLFIAFIGITLDYNQAPEWLSLTAFLALFLAYLKLQNNIWRAVKAVRKAEALQRCLKLRRIRHRRALR